MSYSIDVFVEKKPKDATEWQLVGDRALMENCQHFIINDADFDRADVDGDDFNDIDEPVSEGLLKCYEGGIAGYFVCECTLDDYRTRCSTHIDNFERDFLMCYKALGIACESDDRCILDLYQESQKKYTGAGNIRNGYNQLTFPVDKDLFDDLNRKTARYKKALMWMGLFLHIDFERDTEYRLVFVRIY